MFFPLDFKLIYQLQTWIDICLEEEAALLQGS